MSKHKKSKVREAMVLIGALILIPIFLTTFLSGLYTAIAIPIYLIFEYKMIGASGVFWVFIWGIIAIIGTSPILFFVDDHINKQNRK